MTRSGFTLIEMLVVIALIAFVSSVVAPKGFGIIDSTQRFLDRKRADLELDRLRMIAFSTQKEAIIANHTLTWENNVTEPFPHDITATITRTGLLINP